MLQDLDVSKNIPMLVNLMPGNVAGIALVGKCE